MDSHPLLAELAHIFPAERLLTQAAQLKAYESDALTVFRRRQPVWSSPKAGRR